VSAGPFLYDDGPAPLHTGAPRQRNGLIIGLLGGTVVFSVAMVVLMTLWSGNGEDQSRQVATVFTSALSQGDLTTSYALVCDDVRAAMPPDQLAAQYLHPGVPQVTGSESSEYAGSPAELITVRWDDAGSVTTTVLTLVPEGGTKVCGTTPAS
jgi:hypothetical protein